MTAVGSRRSRVSVITSRIEAMTIGSDDRRRGVGRQRTVAQQAQRHGVEGARLDRVAHVQPAQPSAQFAGGVAGERQCEHVLGVGRAVADSARDPSGQDHRLARSGGGDDRQRRCIGRDRVPLLGIEAAQQALVLVVADRCDVALVPALVFAPQTLGHSVTIGLQSAP